MKKSPVYTVVAAALATALGCASIATGALAGGHGGGGHGGGRGHGGGGHGSVYFYPRHSGGGHYANGYHDRRSYGRHGHHSNRWCRYRDDRWNYGSVYSYDTCWQRRHRHASWVWVCI